MICYDTSFEANLINITHPKTGALSVELQAHEASFGISYYLFF